MTADTFTLREACSADRDFILSLTPVLADVAGLCWHSPDTILAFQKDYILEMLDASPKPSTTVVAEDDQGVIGFVHACSHRDEISGETCGTVPLLAVTQSAQGTGVGKALMAAAEKWALAQDYCLLHLEVFYANEKGCEFYKGIGFKPDTLAMVKPLDNI